VHSKGLKFLNEICSPADEAGLFILIKNFSTGFVKNKRTKHLKQNSKCENDNTYPLKDVQ